MSTSAATLGLETALLVAKDTIKPDGWPCEWNVAPEGKSPEACKIVLNSWMSYFKHLSQHVRDNVTSGGSVKCRMPRCNMLSGATTVNALINHIQDSHMRSVHLPCPFRRCSTLTFTRPTSLEKHILDDHSNSIGMSISYPSQTLLPSRIPFRPVVLDLPYLPGEKPTHGCALIPPVPGTPQKDSPERRKNVKKLCAESSITSIPGSPSKRRHRLQDREATEEPDAMQVDGDAPSEPSIHFEDLPKLEPEIKWEELTNNPAHQALLRPMFTVQPIPTPRMDVARPQEIIDLTLPQYIPRPPPTSILYDAFVVLNNLQNAGMSDDEEEDDDESELTSLPPTTQVSETTRATSPRTGTGTGKKKSLKGVPNATPAS